MSISRFVKLNVLSKRKGFNVPFNAIPCNELPCSQSEYKSRNQVQNLCHLKKGIGNKWRNYVLGVNFECRWGQYKHIHFI